MKCVLLTLLKCMIEITTGFVKLSYKIVNIPKIKIFSCLRFLLLSALLNEKIERLRNSS